MRNCIYGQSCSIGWRKVSGISKFLYLLHNNSLLLKLGNSRIPTDRRVFARLQSLHLFRSQLEAKDVGILLNPGWGYTLWKRDKSLLQTPSQEHLCCGFPILFRERLQNLLLHSLTTDKWRVRLNNDSSFLAPFDDISARQPGMNFKLVDTYHTAFAFSLLLEPGESKSAHSHIRIYWEQIQQQR
jgi:hypothetical protein